MSTMVSRIVGDPCDSEESSIDNIVDEITRSVKATSSSSSSQNFKSKLRGILRLSSQSTVYGGAKSPSKSSSGDNWDEFKYLEDAAIKVKFETCIVKPTYVDKSVQTDQLRSTVVAELTGKEGRTTRPISDDDEDGMAVEIVQPAARRSFSLKEIFRNALDGRMTRHFGQ